MTTRTPLPDDAGLPDGRAGAGQFPETFDDPLCDVPAFFDPLHPAEVSCRCVLKRDHDGDHLGYVATRWAAAGGQP